MVTNDDEQPTEKALEPTQAQTDTADADATLDPSAEDAGDFDIEGQPEPIQPEEVRRGPGHE